MEDLLRRRDLENIAGPAADGTLLLAQADRTASTAAGLVETDAYSAYVLAYDAARFACVALLAQQGLRATSSGGHYAVERAVRADRSPVHNVRSGGTHAGRSDRTGSSAPPAVRCAWRLVLRRSDHAGLRGRAF
ncbi:MAG TPA: hypothetical protein VME44_24575 [Streptosporangiaceae bacterium]|nr:hypothetical protein [Streptosporangiaceae bacterium]